MLVILRCFICRRVDVGCLCLNTSCVFTFHWSIRWAFLLLVEGERCFFFWARLVVSPVLSTAFPALIHTSLTDTALELTCRSKVNFCPSIPECLRSWTSSTGKSIVELSWFLLTVEMYPLTKSRSECGEETNTNCIVFGLTRSWLEPTIYRTWDEHAFHYATYAVHFTKRICLGRYN